VDEKGIEKWFSQYEGVINCEIRDLSISIGDDLAFCHYLHRITRTMADAWRAHRRNEVVPSVVKIG
jgi:ketosteroid isomerase-like protein